MAYSEDDKKAFAEKDLKIVRQSSLKTAVEYRSGKEVTVEELLNTADKFVAWVYGEKEEPAAPVTPVSNTIPEPTMDQAAALQQVSKETGWSREQVYKEFGRYPSTATVESCITAIAQKLV